MLEEQEKRIWFRITENTVQLHIITTWRVYPNVSLNLPFVH